ncbi:MAG: tetraacyldisaccharide 4'-kinase [Burkholderiales bacterium]|nr:tetraacyldisaccharide 4'-kinase [Burkholderiales bacterium]
MRARPSHWSDRGALAWLLAPASLAFGAAVALRRLAYAAGLAARERVPVPVVVVGNLTVGGAGKTPLVAWLARFLAAHGRRPGIVARGWGGGARAPREASAGSDPAEVGDEPVLLARLAGCPVWIGRRRADACRALLARYPACDVIVADDGLQHYALARDLELCVVEARGLGNRFLLPAGPLREPLARLRTVDALIEHGALPPAVSALAPRRFAMRLEGAELVQLGAPGERRPAASFRGRRVHAVAGIGDPQRFFAQLAAFGIEVVPHAFPDHHPFAPADLAFDDDLPVVMTEKDAVKCERFAGPRHWVFPVRAALDSAFGAWLLERLGGPAAA